MKKNNGYTLVELIISLAIIAILSGLAFASIGIIHQAKYNEAANTIKNQMSTLWVQTKTTSQAKEQPSAADPSAVAHSVYPLCMLIKKNADDTFSVVYGYDNGTSFVEKDPDEVAATLPKIIKIEYVAKNNGQKHSGATKLVQDSAYNSQNMVDEVLIEFNKTDGSVIYGAGTYNIIYNDRVVASVYLDSVTGKHYIK